MRKYFFVSFYCFFVLFCANFVLAQPIKECVLTNGNGINVKYISPYYCDKDRTMFSTYEILENAGIIPSIFVRDNETKISWVDSTAWTYIFKFSWDSSYLNKNNIGIFLNNLSQESSIFLNDSLVKKTNNGFICYQILANKNLLQGENTLKICFTPSVLKDRVFVRTPQYRYGWDWYPRMLAPTIQSVYLSTRIRLDNYITLKGKKREISLVRQKDKWGESFYFTRNGKPIFVKGANYIFDESNDLEHDIKEAASAHINMLRIWGGSGYGSEEFYNLCDKYGIMVWQDFPFACEPYPADSSFLNNVAMEVADNLKRISRHPSLALLCGNNEIWEGWQNWGWKEESKDTIKDFALYNKLFKDLLPSLVAKYAPGVSYIHSSPVDYGWGHPESLTNGDCHYWGVWWADSTFETLARKVPRFMSEYGFQSCPTIETVREYMSLPYSKDNPAFAIHQKHPRGFELIEARIKEWYGSYTNDEDYVYKSQATAQEAYKIAIEAHRRAKPYCMGTMFWQFNDPYPAIGWGCLDNKGREKPTFKTIVKCYEDIIFSIDKYSCSDSVFIYVCSDKDKKYSLSFQISIYDNNGIEKYSIVQNNINLKPQESRRVFSLDIKDIKDFNPKTDYLWVSGTLKDKKNKEKAVNIKNYCFFVYPKDYINISKYNEVKSKFYEEK